MSRCMETARAKDLHGSAELIGLFMKKLNLEILFSKAKPPKPVPKAK